MHGRHRVNDACAAKPDINGLDGRVQPKALCNHAAHACKLLIAHALHPSKLHNEQ